MSAAPWHVPSDGTDATVQYQAWLDSVRGTGYPPAGVYTINNTLRGKPGSTIAGPYRGAHTVIKGPAFPPGVPMFQVDGGGFSLLHMAFDGANQPTTNSLMAFLSVSDLSVNDCALLHSRYMGMQVSQCPRATIEASLFRDYGKSEVTAEGGAAIWTDRCDDLRIRRNLFQLGEWSAVYWDGRRGEFTDNVGLRCKESFVFGGSFGVTYARNRIEDQRIKFVSAHGFEVGGENNTFADNVLRRIDGEGIHVGGAKTDVIGNTIESACRDLVAFPDSGCIAVFSFDPDGAPYDVNVADNDLFDPTNSTPYGIVLARGNIPASKLMHDISVENNRVSGTHWMKAAIACDPSEGEVCGENVRIGEQR